MLARRYVQRAANMLRRIAGRPRPLPACYDTGAIPADLKAAKLLRIRPLLRPEVVAITHDGYVDCLPAALRDAAHVNPDGPVSAHDYDDTALELIADLSEPLSQEVPDSGLPIWTASHYLARWAAGLSGPTRDAFLDLTVRELAAEPQLQLERAYVRRLPRAFNEELASTTALVARKPND